MQSAYRKHHSTDTTLLRVTNDILRRIVVLVLVDLSAAFDTIDHTILVSQNCAGSDVTLKRLQSIVIGDQVSTPCALRNVPKKDLYLERSFSRCISSIFKT